jgi:protease I
MGPDEAPWHRRALLAPDDLLLNAGLSSRGFALLLDSEADAAAVEGGEDNAAAATDTHSWRCDMADRLDGRRVVVLLAEGFEDLEFWVTVMRLQEEGAQVTVAGLTTQPVHGKNGLEATADVEVDAVSADTVDAVVVPGGWAPDKLRRYDAVKNLVGKAYHQGKVVGLICHAGLVGISAGIVDGKRATGSLGIKDDLVNAGATWVDAPALRDGNLVWGRVVPDIPAFCRELVAAIEAGQPG